MILVEFFAFTWFTRFNETSLPYVLLSSKWFDFSFISKISTRMNYYTECASHILFLRADFIKKMDFVSF